MVRPTLPEFLEHLERGKRLPLRRRIPADLETPASAFLKLKRRGAAFLLESVEQGVQVGRYSFIGLSPHATITLRDGMIETARGDVVGRASVDEKDPFSAIRDELSLAGDRLDGKLPGPFAGAVGYISYDVVRYFEEIPVPKSDPLGLPDYHFVFPGALAVFDHVKSEMEILALPADGEPEEAYIGACDQIALLLDALESPLVLAGEGRQSPRRADPGFNMTRADFEKKVLAAKEHILAGDIFQVVLSQRLRGPADIEPFQIYRALRILNPSPYMFFLDFGGFQLIGSSPEMLVKLEGHNATLCPIAGTRRRGRTAAEDGELEDELLSNEKERAEHTMLVDLGRNDLGRVCEVGSVVTQSLMKVERYSHVMHLVSRVAGRLGRKFDMFDLLRASFAAGTVTGAPKIRAMEIISDLEGERRGPYAGAVGYFGVHGDMDLCIAIRTLITKGKEYFAQAGAGIVADSDPASEFQETLDKIEALTRAIEIAEEGF